MNRRFSGTSFRKRATVCCSSVSLVMNDKNCFGTLSTLRGQNLVPLPPAIMTTFIEIDHHLQSRDVPYRHTKGAVLTQMLCRCIQMRNDHVTAFVRADGMPWRACDCGVNHDLPVSVPCWVWYCLTRAETNVRGRFLEIVQHQCMRCCNSFPRGESLDMTSMRRVTPHPNPTTNLVGVFTGG